MTFLARPIKYVALGDSFTEGVGDELPDGSVRGWADRFAQGLADATGETVMYANLAVRGRLLEPIIREQLEPALALGPTLVSFNGGGNDMLRPGTNLEWILERTRTTMERILAAGASPLLLAGANPTAGIPGGKRVREKGDTLTAGITEVIADLPITFVDNWSDATLAHREYWSLDRLHLNAVGHARVAHNILSSYGLPTPETWPLEADPLPKPGVRDELRYTREHVLPWIGRRLTRRSSGDGRQGKHLSWVPVTPS